MKVSKFERVLKSKKNPPRRDLLLWPSTPQTTKRLSTRAKPGDETGAASGAPRPGLHIYLRFRGLERWESKFPSFSLNLTKKRALEIKVFFGEKNVFAIRVSTPEHEIDQTGRRSIMR
jgi:hypothetical protein